MSNTDKVKDDTEKDYLHPEGKPAVAPTTSEEKKNLAKAEASTELVEEISKDSDSTSSTKGAGDSKAKDGARKKDDDDTLKLHKV